MTALAAFHADVGAQAGDFPGMAAAGMGFSHANDIIHLQVGQHARIISHVIILPADTGIALGFHMFNFSPQLLISAVITLLISLTVHEFSHAWVATRFGDDTPRLYGRLTLNPLAHLDPLGSLMLILAGFGWAKPVPVNFNTLRRSSRAAPMLVSISGPVSNFLMAALAAIPLRFGLVPNQASYANFLPTPSSFLVFFLATNLGLMVFNLLPVPPLDGNEIIHYLLPPAWSQSWENIRPYGVYILFALLFFGPLIGFDLIQIVLRPIIQSLAYLLLGVPL